VINDQGICEDSNTFDPCTCSGVVFFGCC
jgi:hypothetical protein